MEQAPKIPPAAGVSHALKKYAIQRKFLLLMAIIATAAAGYMGWRAWHPVGLPPGIASGNGRIEAVAIDIDTKYPGRVMDIMADEGDFVHAGEVIARMDTVQLDAQLREAQANEQRALIGIQTARTLVTQRQYEKAAAAATVEADQAQLDAAKLRLNRSQRLVGKGAVPRQTVDDDQAAYATALASLAQGQAQTEAANAAIETARAGVIDAQAALTAAQAAVQNVQAQINDATLTAPRNGRVQYRVAQPGEVLAAGGRVLNMIDLTDVYMTFYLPTAQAGRVALGAQARIVLDAAPQYVIPARITYVADVAQFTPKTVETADERAKLMFRVKARIPPALLRRYITEVKTGLPGIAYVRLDSHTPWPAALSHPLTP